MYRDTILNQLKVDLHLLYLEKKNANDISIHSVIWALGPKLTRGMQKKKIPRLNERKSGFYKILVYIVINKRWTVSIIYIFSIIFRLFNNLKNLPLISHQSKVKRKFSCFRSHVSITKRVLPFLFGHLSHVNN